MLQLYNVRVEVLAVVCETANCFFSCFNFFKPRPCLTPNPRPVGSPSETSPKGEGSFEIPLKECLDYIGCELTNNKSRKFHEAHWGIKEKAAVASGSSQVICVFPGSVADGAGLCFNDEIISVNGFELKNDLADWSGYFSFREIIFVVKRNQQIFETKLKPSKEIFYRAYFINKLDNASERQKENFQRWTRRKF